MGANLDVMHADTRCMRTNAQGLKPFVMTNLKTLAGMADVVKFIETRGMLKKSAPAPLPPEMTRSLHGTASTE